jgi:hypothetical protein
MELDDFPMIESANDVRRWADQVGRLTHTDRKLPQYSTETADSQTLPT